MVKKRDKSTQHNLHITLHKTKVYKPQRLAMNEEKWTGI